MEAKGYEIRSGADLAGADLVDADLRAADLSNAHLAGAVMNSADLSGACMRSLEPYFDRASPLDAALIPQWRISRKSSLDQDGSFPSQATEIKT